MPERLYAIGRNKMTMWDALFFFSLSGLCIAAFLLRYHVLTTPMKWVGVAHGINVLSLGVGQIMMINGSQNNLFIFHFSLILVYTAYATAFYFAFNSRRLKRVILVSIGCFAFVSLLCSATIQPLAEYNSYALTLANLLYLTWSLTYLNTLFSEVKIASLEQDPLFWVCIGLLFSSVGNFFAIGLMNYMIQRWPQHAYEVQMLVEVMWFLLVFTLLIAVFADKLFARK